MHFLREVAYYRLYTSHVQFRCKGEGAEKSGGCLEMFSVHSKIILVYLYS
jgi:hypothetical protein